MIITNDLKFYINNFIRYNILSNLNLIEFEEIIYLLYDLIDFIAIRFNIINIDEFNNQLKQNNNQDLLAIFNLLFPFIDDNGGKYNLHKEIYNLKDISIKKKKSHDITKNNFIISNIQLSRGIINPNYLKKYYTVNKLSKSELEDLYGNIESLPLIKYQNNMFNKINIEENQPYLYYELNILDIKINYYLLLKTINTVSHKLYINWISILPITWNYKNSSLYKNTYKLYNNTSIVDTPFVININNKLLYAEPWIPIYFNDHDELDKRFNVIRNNKSQDYDLLKEYRGIALDDFYNIIHHELYFGIRDYKWLLYEITYDNKIINLLTYLENYFKITETKEWSKLTDQEQINWEIQKSKLGSSYENNNDKLLIYNILLFFEYRYSKSLQLTDYIRLPIKRHIDLPADQILDIIDQENEINYDNLDSLKLLESWNSLKIEDLFYFLHEVYDGFKKTWYGYRMLTKNERVLKFDNKEIIIEGQHILSYKNIYNWAKCILISLINSSINHISSLTIDKLKEDKEEMELLKLIKEYTWNSYHYIIQLGFCNFILNRYSEEIINFVNVLRRNNNNLTYNKSKSILREIDRNIKKNLTDIVFESLILRGLLSEYYIDSSLTNKKYLDKDTKKAKILQQNLLLNKIIKPRYKDLEACYYYLTNQPYEKLDKIVQKNKKPKEYLLNLFENKKSNWYLMYAMDWISQISLYHRLINKQVILITGGTGVGKTSQVPKLLLYSLKMIYFRKNGNVIATVPRTNIAKGASDFMANSLGVPIKIYNKEKDQIIKTYGNYVQYKTKKDSHEFDSNISNYYIKIVTDGTLLEEMYRNPILKKQYISDEDQEKYKSEELCEYLVQNKYDILFIDESHEHNKNMDLILSLLKYTLYFNNSIKLIISSATMEDDEPIYRRFYKSLNDNYIFPISLSNLGLGFIDNNNIISLDRSVIDCRVHISPPGETTQYIIKEYYLSKDTNNYDEAEILGLEKLKELFRLQVSGDILFFSVTKPKINKLVELINKISPSYTLAIPYYSDLPKEFSDIEDFVASKHTFNINKLDIINQIINNIPGRKVSIGTYKQVVIVATNIAEASITVDTLKHVIDTGYFNNVIYDPDTDKSTPILDKISEASRKQRKGRVGRVAPGDVYYMYKKGTRENIKPNYQICITDFKYDIMKLYRKTLDETEYINYRLFDINNISLNIYVDKLEFINKNTVFISNMRYEREYNNFIKNISDNKLKIQSDKLKSIIKYNRSLFGCSYYLGGCEYTSYNAINNVRFLSNYNIDIPLPRLFTGYPISSIFDIIGNFYIIHPSEKLLNRHLLTGIILDTQYSELGRMKYLLNMINYYNNLISINAIIPNSNINFMSSLSIYKKDQISIFLDNNYSNLIYYYINIFNQKINSCYDDILEKTEFYNRVIYIENKIDLELYGIDPSLKYGCIVALIYSYLYDCRDIIIFIIASLCITKLELKTWIKPSLDKYNRINYDYKKLPWRVFGNKYGDLITIYYIYNNLKIYINNLTKKKDKSDISIDRKYSLAINEYNKIDKKNLANKLNTNLKLDIFEKLQQLDNKNKLNKQGFRDFKLLFIEKYNNLTNFEINILKEWADTYNINYDIIESIIKINIRLLSTINNFENQYNEHFTWFKKNFKVNKSKIIEDNIIKCFIHGFNMNIILHDFNKKIFYKLLSPIIRTYDYKYLFKSIYKSLLDYSITDIGKLLLYLGIDQKNQTCIINNIKFEWLFECLIHLYNPYTLDYKNRNELNNELFNKLINLYNNKYITNHIINNTDNTNNLIGYYKILRKKIDINI